MSIIIYYFSGTGNSLAVARDIAGKTNGELIPLASIMDTEKIEIQADKIGIVFPTYYEPYGGVPLIVRRFIRKLDNITNKYIFAICTYGSGTFNAMDCLEKLIEARGGKLAAGFTVNMPNNMAGSRINNLQKQEKMFRVWEENMETILEMINTKKEGKLDAPNVLVGRIYALIKLIVPPMIFLFKPLTLSHLKRYSYSKKGSYAELLPFMDRSFYTNDKCVGCGNCAIICPVKNIEMVNDQPSWQHQCEFCLACFHWCSKEAIESHELENTVRYHQPNIQMSDMILKD